MRKANNDGDQHHQDVYLHFQSIVPLSTRHPLPKQEAFQQLKNGYLPLLSAILMWVS
jgi:hypothetical protein